jgi:predicted RNase H-like HicB family nuclease
MKLTFEIWRDENWFLARSRHLPGLFTQGRSLEEVAANAVDACQLLLAEGNDFGSGDAGVPSRPSGSPFLETSVELELPENTQDDWGAR